MRISISPRFSEVDVLGHVTNSAVPVWFEEGRSPIFRYFSSTENMSDLSLILRRYEIDFLHQIRASHEVIIDTEIDKIGRSSITITQEARQLGEVIATGTSTMVHFDFSNNVTREISKAKKLQLSPFFKINWRNNDD